ncbi:hypothetical protein ACWPKO_08755 [Coraliomargarita sp. W4R53]
MTELILPRNGIARKSALTDVHLLKGKRSLARAPFYETGLLKEKVDGRVGLKVSVTRPLKRPELVQFARQLLGTSLEGLGDAAALSAFPSLSLSAFAKGGRELLSAPFEALADTIADDAADFIATGGMDFDSELLATGKVTIPLKLTKAIRHSEQPPGPKSRDKRKANTKHYNKGSQIGELSLDFYVES